MIDGTAAAGTATAWARADHVHPASAAAGGDTTDIAYFGDGSDGAATITTAVTLTRDMYYSNLTISGAGSLNTFGWRVFVSGVLDISAAAAAAIVGATITSGRNTQVASYSYGTSTSAGTGGSAVAGAGTAPAVIAGTVYLGGLGGVGGAGGATGGAGGAVTPNSYPPGRLRLLTATPVPLPFWTGSGLATSFAPGVGGSGGGAGAVSGWGAGGGGGASGTLIFLYARTINRGPSTGIGAISAAGLVGAVGANATAGSGGGGGGGGGEAAARLTSFIAF